MPKHLYKGVTIELDERMYCGHWGVYTYSHNGEKFKTTHLKQAKAAIDHLLSPDGIAKAKEREAARLKYFEGQRRLGIIKENLRALPAMDVYIPLKATSLYLHDFLASAVDEDERTEALERLLDGVLSKLEKGL